MLKFCILFGVIAACYADTSIVGGVPVEIEDFPYVASVQAPGNKGHIHVSTGTILNNRWILTTASSLAQFTDPHAFRISTGSSLDFKASTVFNVEEKIQHPSYDPLKLNEFNLALLKVTQDIVFNEKTKSIGLFTEDTVNPNLSGSLAGWGDTFNATSLKVSQLFSIELKTVGTIDGLNLHVSAIGDGVCYSDLGGAFVVDGKVFGISTLDRLGCGLTDQYVTRFDTKTLEWINSIIA